METNNINIKCQSSLGKRKVTCLKGIDNDVHPSEMSMTFNADWKGVSAACWLKDADGRVLGLTISSEGLKKIRAALEKAFAEHAEYAARIPTCHICKRALPNVETEDGRLDCGGDCSRCMRECGDPS